ncbi:hypothetical protein [Mammaliicoccus lentus]|uniref:hypothetical protein n=1 Tax=Mammaliicoccus lentus TaxID=42858 RepID=UPI001072686A|nr:hypothetical protein [Mammaliicoccus lentus]MBF0795200.1 hypothetical protein [Mammaliicoccus lentus]TFV14600.1 hypothetical protein E4T78_11080 [Mammaliicoccus lentus]
MKEHEIEQVIEKREELEHLLKVHSDKLKELPQLENGLYTDEVRATDFYKYHSNQCTKYFKELRRFNMQLTKRQQQEIARYKRARRFS